MNKSTTPFSILLAGLLAVAGVQAQSISASGSSNLPPKAGEASTRTDGVPNLDTTNSVTPAPALDKDQVRQDAHGLSSASATTAVPGRAGEATTMVNGRPNLIVDPHSVARSRADVVGELMQRRDMYEAARRNAHAMGYGSANPR